METEIKIIKLLIEQKKQMTIREIAKEIESDYKITYVAMQRLIKKNVVLSVTIGKSTVCELNQKYYGLDIYQAEDERRKKILKNSDLKLITKEIIEKIGTNLFILLLFGSYAKGMQTKHSDFDIMVISNEKNTEQILHDKVTSLLPFDIHLLIFTEKEFISMKDGKDLTVVTEAIKNNIILYSIENYYRLKNV